MRTEVRKDKQRFPRLSAPGFSPQACLTKLKRRFRSIIQYSAATHFICLNRKATFGSYAVVFVSYGFSRSIDVGERSAVGRSLIIAACPPMALAEPGRTKEV